MRKCDSEKTNVRTKTRAYASLPDVTFINRKWSWNCAQLAGVRSPPCKRPLIKKGQFNLAKTPVNKKSDYTAQLISHTASLLFMMNSVLARTSLLLDIQIAAVLWLCHKEKCVRLLRPWRGGKHFSTSKTVFINMSFGVDLSVRTL